MSKPHGEAIIKILVSPDCQMFSTASKDGTSKIWEIPCKKMIETLEAFTTNCIKNRENLRSLT